MNYYYFFCLFIHSNVMQNIHWDVKQNIYSNTIFVHTYIVNGDMMLSLEKRSPVVKIIEEEGMLLARWEA